MSIAKIPFSRPFAVSALRDKGGQIAITAIAAERAALAAEFGLVAIASLEADFASRRTGRTGLEITGKVRARLTQSCVMTLEPFESLVVAPVEARFDSGKRPEDIAFGIEDQDPPDPIVDGKIDLGALAAEFLALSLDPYPRKPDAAFDPEKLGVASKPESPFASLKEKLTGTGQKN